MVRSRSAHSVSSSPGDDRPRPAAGRGPDRLRTRPRNEDETPRRATPRAPRSARRAPAARRALRRWGGLLLSFTGVLIAVGSARDPAGLEAAAAVSCPAGTTSL